MRESIPKAVAMPPRLFWAPMAPGGANMAVHLCIMLISQGFGSVNPLWFISSLVITHVAIIIAGVKEPHLSKMMEAQGPFIRNYTNIYPERGRKLSS